MLLVSALENQTLKHQNIFVMEQKKQLIQENIFLGVEIVEKLPPKFGEKHQN